MRALLVPLAFAAFASQLAAQAPLNLFHVYSGRTSFTSRGFLSGNAGETLQGYTEAQYRGIGDAGYVEGPKTCVVHGFGMITQDQDQTTVETYWVVFRGATATGEPDGTPAGVIAEAGPFDLPTGSGTGAAAWRINIDLGDGVQVPCKGKNYYAGLRLSENLSWTSDGQSTHASAYTDPASTSGDPVAAGAPSWAYQVDAAGAVRPTNPRSWNYDLQTERGALQIGCVQTTDGLFGNCGNYPDVTVQGLAFRIRDEAQADDGYVLLVADSLIGGAPIPLEGHLWINLGTMFTVASGVLDGNGTAEFVPSGFGPGELVDLAGFGNLPFQVAILDFGAGRLPFRMTNAQASRL